MLSLRRNSDSWKMRITKTQKILYISELKNQLILFFGLLLERQKSPIIMICWTHGNVDFLLYLQAYLSNRGVQKPTQIGCNKLENVWQNKHATKHNKYEFMSVLVSKIDPFGAPWAQHRLLRGALWGARSPPGIYICTYIPIYLYTYIPIYLYVYSVTMC